MIWRALLAALLIMGGWTGAAAAASGSLVGVRPLAPDASWIVLAAAPGEVVAAEAVVLNLSDAPQVVDLSTADALTTEDGVFTLGGAAETPAGVGAWIDAPVGRLALAAGERRAVRFHVRVPRDAAPGDHAGGLVVQSASAAGRGDAGGVAVRVVERVGLRVYVSVAGARADTVVVENLETRVRGRDGLGGALGLGGDARVGFAVRNTGNVQHPRLTGEVALLEGSRRVAARPIDLGTMLPGDVRPVALDLPLPGWSPGGYRVAVRIDAGAPGTAEADVRVDALRLYSAGGLALGAVALAGGAWRLRRRRAG